MARIIPLILMFGFLFLISCKDVDLSKLPDSDLSRIAKQVIVCEKPYMRFETGCCLDQNENKVCDNDDKNASEITSVTINSNEDTIYIKFTYRS